MRISSTLRFYQGPRGVPYTHVHWNLQVQCFAIETALPGRGDVCSRLVSTLIFYTLSDKKADAASRYES